MSIEIRTTCQRTAVAPNCDQPANPLDVPVTTTALPIPTMEAVAKTTTQPASPTITTNKQKATRPWLLGCLMAAAVGFAVGVSLVAQYQDKTTNPVPSGEMAADNAPSHSQGQKSEGPAEVMNTGEFIHIFATCLYVVDAPVDVFLLTRYHLRHRRRVPRICMCLLVATVGGLVCLIGWLFAHSLLLAVGLTAAAGSHAVSIAVERAQMWSRTLR